MNNAFQIVLYEIATKTMLRVALKANPGMVGIFLQKDNLANAIQVHWGYDNKAPIRRWHPVADLIYVVPNKSRNGLSEVDHE